ncbi:MAG: winged helix DNA-binding domain-containing protein [Bacteroidota bacterium]|nr:winged helix DNA-binding domain-containing protein [Bacteroidota bacterium]MDP4213180.1 winged helix DNA-binding domain-containing protein [Bacteroidota bacterium]MDP4250842.1 winged helix DNA-binding domain-containing protein [Bacteroidota bacterium]
MDILNHRLANQQLSAHQFSRPDALVSWLGAMQAQNYAMAKWAIGCRLTGVTETRVEKDFNEGKILRTHVLRPTWHFVSPKDIRWMLKLTAPTIKALSRGHHRALGIDSGILKRSSKIIEKVLATAGPKTRLEIQESLLKSGIKTSDTRLGFLLMDAELDGLICSAGRKGKQFAYGLLDWIVPEYEPLKRVEAVSELAVRYFRGHGPATIDDFAWWSGLPLAEIRLVLPILKSELISVQWQGDTYWFSKSMTASESGLKDNYFLPAFDEYFIGYKNRKNLLDSAFSRQIQTANGIFNPIIIKNGQIAGTWKRNEQKSELLIELSPFSDSSRFLDKKLLTAIGKYYRFLGRKGEIAVL